MKEVSNLGHCVMRNFIIPTGLNMHLRLGGQDMQEEFGCRDLLGKSTRNQAERRIILR